MPSLFVIIMLYLDQEFVSGGVEGKDKLIRGISLLKQQIHLQIVDPNTAE